MSVTNFWKDNAAFLEHPYQIACTALLTAVEVQTRSHWSFWSKPEIRGKDRFSASVAHPMDALKRSLGLCGEVEGEKEMVEANILVTEHAAVARFVENEIIDGARIAKTEQIKSR